MSTATVALKLFLAGFILAAAGMTQNWEMGGGVGYGAYRNSSITGSAGTAEAGIRNRYAVSGIVGEDPFEHVSGEVRYIYHPGDTFLKAGSSQGGVQALSHTMTYDILLHLKTRHSRIRPYAAAGAGAKFYDTTGALPKPQPAPGIAGLTTQSQWEPAFDFGAGVKFRVMNHVVVRGDVRDYISLSRISCSRPPAARNRAVCCISSHPCSASDTPFNTRFRIPHITRRNTAK